MRLALELEGCDGIDPVAVRRVLDVELEGADLDASPDDATATVRLLCRGEVATLSLTTPSASLTRELVLGGDRSMSRLIALAIAELVAASAIRDPTGVPEPTTLEPAPDDVSDSSAPDPSTPDPSVTFVPDPELAPPAAEVAPRRTRDLGVRAFALGSVAGEPLHAAFGGGAGLDALLLAPLALRVDVRGAHGVTSFDTTEVRRTQLTVGAFLALRVPLDASFLDVGLGARGGLGVLEGSNTSALMGSALLGPVLAVAATSQLSIELVDALFLHVGLELGWGVVGLAGTIAATGQIIAYVGGPALDLTLGLEVRP